MVKKIYVEKLTEFPIWPDPEGGVDEENGTCFSVRVDGEVIAYTRDERTAAMMVDRITDEYFELAPIDGKAEAVWEALTTNGYHKEEFENEEEE